MNESWVKIRLHTENQLPRLSGSVGGWWWVPTHYQVKLQLQLRLSWAVTIHISNVVPYLILECERLQLVYSKENVAKSLCPLESFFFLIPSFRGP